MMSDALSDAAALVRRYVQTYPEIYGPHMPQILQTLEAMDSLRRTLDTPPDFSAPPVREANESLMPDPDTFYARLSEGDEIIIWHGPLPALARVVPTTGRNKHVRVYLKREKRWSAKKLLQPSQVMRFASEADRARYGAEK